MAKALALNATNDIYKLPNGKLAMVNDVAAVAQTCGTATKAQRGEMILNSGAGVTSFQDIWIGVPNIAQYQASIQQQLQAVAGVLRVVSITTSVKDNKFSYQAVVQTQYGTSVING